MLIFYIKEKSKTKPEYTYYVTKDGKIIKDDCGFKREMAKLNTGYKSQYLSSIGHNGKRDYIHRTVYIAFKGPIPIGKEIDHIDHNKHNNHIDNLRAVYPRENSRHREDSGRGGHGTTFAEIKVQYPDGTIKIAIGVSEASSISGLAKQTIYGALCYGNEPKGYSFNRIGTVQR